MHNSQGFTYIYLIFFFWDKSRVWEQNPHCYITKKPSIRATGWWSSNIPAGQDRGSCCRCPLPEQMLLERFPYLIFVTPQFMSYCSSLPNWTCQNWAKLNRAKRQPMRFQVWKLLTPRDTWTNEKNHAVPSRHYCESRNLIGQKVNVTGKRFRQLTSRDLPSLNVAYGLFSR